jgi:hypothetical protein
LLVRVGVHSNIQRKGIDTKCFGSLHIIIVVRGTGTIAYNANLKSFSPPVDFWQVTRGSP